MEGSSRDARCSFCGKPQDQERRLVGGPGGVYICNLCVALCTEVLAQDASHLPPPTDLTSLGSSPVVRPMAPDRPPPVLLPPEIPKPVKP